MKSADESSSVGAEEDTVLAPDSASVPAAAEPSEVEPGGEPGQSSGKDAKPREMEFFYTVADVAKKLNVSTTHVYGLIKKGELKAIKLGRKVMLARQFVDKMVAELLSQAGVTDTAAAPEPQATANNCETATLPEVKRTEPVVEVKKIDCDGVDAWQVKMNVEAKAGHECDEKAPATERPKKAAEIMEMLRRRYTPCKFTYTPGDLVEYRNRPGVVFSVRARLAFDNGNGSFTASYVLSGFTSTGELDYHHGVAEPEIQFSGPRDSLTRCLLQLDEAKHLAVNGQNFQLAAAIRDLEVQYFGKDFAKIRDAAKPKPESTLTPEMADLKDAVLELGNLMTKLGVKDVGYPGKAPKAGDASETGRTAGAPDVVPCETVSDTVLGG